MFPKTPSTTVGQGVRFDGQMPWAPKKRCGCVECVKDTCCIMLLHPNPHWLRRETVRPLQTWPPRKLTVPRRGSKLSWCHLPPPDEISQAFWPETVQSVQFVFLFLCSLFFNIFGPAQRPKVKDLQDKGGDGRLRSNDNFGGLAVQTQAFLKSACHPVLARMCRKDLQDL